MSDLITEPCEFWMVWTKNRRPPRFLHSSEASAMAEAERLALLNPGRKFIVLRAEAKVHLKSLTQTEGAAA